MPVAGTCSECPNRLVDADGKRKPAGTKTCSKNCRQARARRIKRAQRESGLTSKYDPATQDLAAAVRGEVKDTAHEVLKEELRPLVREAMTADVLDGIGRLIQLTPAAIAVLQTQLKSGDETIAQRAATLMLKYTMGNPSVAPPPTQQAPAPMSVVFNVPRAELSPGDITLESSDAEELRHCDDCGDEKPDIDFVGASSRCFDCFKALQSKVEERLGE